MNNNELILKVLKDNLKIAKKYNLSDKISSLEKSIKEVENRIK